MNPALRGFFIIVFKGTCKIGFRWRVAYSGGNYNNEANAGVAYLNADNDSSNANTNVGARLYFFNLLQVTLPLGKKIKHKQPYW